MLELEEVLQNGQEVLSGNQQGDDTRLGCVVEFRVLNFRRYVQNVPNESDVFKQLVLQFYQSHICECVLHLM